MSKSILKSSDGKRLVPIRANEGNSDSEYDSLNKVKPWSHVDEEPLMMNDVHHEISRIHGDLEKMHHRMMGNFPQPPQLPHMIPPPALLPPPAIFPPEHLQPNMIMPPAHAQMLSPLQRNGSPNPDKMLAIRDSSSPCGSLERRPRGMQMATIPGPHHQMAFNPPEMGFGPRDMMIPHHMPPTIPMAPPAPTPVFTEDEYGNKIVELVLDLKGFMPEDIFIHTEHNVLHVHARRLSAKHDVTGHGNVEDARVAKDCRRQYALPEVVRAENLSCFVNPKGQLTIEGPLGPDIIRRNHKKKVKFVHGRK